MHAGDFAGGWEPQVHLRLLVQGMTQDCCCRVCTSTSSSTRRSLRSLICFSISTTGCFTLQTNLTEYVQSLTEVCFLFIKSRIHLGKLPSATSLLQLHPHLFKGNPIHQYLLVLEKKCLLLEPLVGTPV